MNLEWIIISLLALIVYSQHRRLLVLEDGQRFFYKEMTEIYEKFNEVLRRLTND
jgi:hypothetical protein